MEISQKVTELLKAEIQNKVRGYDSLISDIEVNHKGISYFVEFEFKSTASHQETVTGAWLGTDMLEIIDLTAHDKDMNELTIDNYFDVTGELEYTANWD